MNILLVSSFFTFYLSPSLPLSFFLYFTRSGLLSDKSSVSIVARALRAIEDLSEVLLVSLLLPARLGDSDFETSFTDMPTVYEYLWSAYSYFCMAVPSKTGYSKYIIHVTDTCESLTSVPFYAVFLMTVK